MTEKVDTPEELAVAAAIAEAQRVFNSQRAGVAAGESAASALVERLLELKAALERDNESLRIMLLEATSKECGAVHVESGVRCSLQMHHAAGRHRGSTNGGILWWPR